MTNFWSTLTEPERRQFREAQAAAKIAEAAGRGKWNVDSMDGFDAEWHNSSPDASDLGRMSR